jgi:hypothetical protein
MNAEAHVEMARCLLQLNQRDGARRSLERAVRSQPSIIEYPLYDSVESGLARPQVE